MLEISSVGDIEVNMEKPRRLQEWEEGRPTYDLGSYLKLTDEMAPGYTAMIKRFKPAALSEKNFEHLRDSTALISMLRCHCKGVPFQESDLIHCGKMLSARANRVRVRQDEIYYITYKTRPGRIVAEDLIRYLSELVKEPNLLKYDPIGCCAKCDNIFLKTKITQLCCSNKCYQTYWKSGMLDKNPAYYAEKARDSRKHYRKLNKKDGKL
jgi:hypothetical protein